VTAKRATKSGNITLRAMFLGIHPREMERRINEMTDFTELGAYIDMPVRTYSSRLSFAAATAVAPGILPMDPWLAVSALVRFFFIRPADRPVGEIGLSGVGASECRLG
jgi:ABC-type polysaccharide/polyol phosphate transport system ATPase subunit